MEDESTWGRPKEGSLGQAGLYQPGWSPMRITCCYSTGRVETTVTRGLDNDERRVVISAPWGQLPVETFVKIRDQLTDEERQEVAKAFGWTSSS